MTFLLVVALGVVALAVVFLTIPRTTMGTAAELERFPFEQTRPLKEQERIFYWRLRKVLPEQMILAQVFVSSFVRVEKGHDLRAWFNRINRMTVDFLVCLPDGTIVAAIELDEATHEIDERLFVDARKAKVLESAGIKLLRFTEIPSEVELHRIFLE